MKNRYLLLLVSAFISFPVTAQVDYASEIQPIFNARCVSCHGANGGVSLASYDDVINANGNSYGTNVVVPGDPDASGLVDKIEPSPQFGSRMPLGQAALSSNEINLIRQWIAEGANATATSNEGEITGPGDFRLIGNYPNPFNPATQIQFELPVSAQYTIALYNMNGQLIGEHVGNAAAGLARVNVELNNSPSGLYIYQVTALAGGNRYLVGTGKMTLIK